MAEHQARRRWIKLWTQETLHGTTLKELEPDERAVWFEALCAAGDSIKPGFICVDEDTGFTDKQLASMFKVPIELLKRALTKLQSEAVHKIKLNHDGIIEICNWERYQSDERREYLRKYQAERRRKEREKKEIRCILAFSTTFLLIRTVYPFA